VSLPRLVRRKLRRHRQETLVVPGDVALQKRDDVA
jgi:hypothetical protein